MTVAIVVGVIWGVAWIQNVIHSGNLAAKYGDTWAV